MGSRLNVDLAYIAGFLDGDGSIMLQVKKRSDTKRGFRFMATICLYQDTRHDKPLYWIRDVLGIGYITKRKDGMSELRINGFSTINSLLRELEPYIKFKQAQVKSMIKATNLLAKDINMLSNEELKCLVSLILIIQNENYKLHTKRNQQEFYKILNLTP